MGKTTTILAAVMTAAAVVAKDAVTTRIFSTFGLGGAELLVDVCSEGDSYGDSRIGIMMWSDIRTVSDFTDTSYQYSLFGPVGMADSLRKPLLEIARKINTFDSRCDSQGVDNLEKWEVVGVVTDALETVSAGWTEKTLQGSYVNSGSSLSGLHGEAGERSVFIEFTRKNGMSLVRFGGNYAMHHVVMFKWDFYALCNSLDPAKIKKKVTANIAIQRKKAAGKAGLFAD